MEKPKVSVIMPIYKAEEFIKRGVDSILNQTLREIEVILIDDGSPDNCGRICDEYASADPRVKVVHQPNQGVAAARQVGFEQTEGEYVIHADPDDWVEAGMLEALYDKAKAEDADLVICDYYEVLPKGTFLRKQKPTALDPSVLQGDLYYRLFACCWNKLIRRSTWVKYGISFPDPKLFRVWSDKVVNNRLLAHPLKIAYLPEAYYYYDNVINPGSLIHTRKRFTIEQMQEIVDEFGTWVNPEGPAYGDFKKFAALNLASSSFWEGKMSSAAYAKYNFPRLKDLLLGYGGLSSKIVYGLSSIGLYRLMYKLLNSRHKEG